MKIHESGENYLETILMLSETKSEVHAVDIAAELGFSKPSVSRAISILRSNGCVNVTDNGVITLTPAGRGIAETMYSRHKFLTDWLTGIGVNAETAANDACRIEHDISEESFRCIEEYVKKAGQTNEKY